MLSTSLIFFFSFDGSYFIFFSSIIVITIIFDWEGGFISY